MNTIVSSILLLAACGLLLTLIRSPRSSLMRERLMTEDYLRGQSIFKNSMMQIEKMKPDSVQPEWIKVGRNVIAKCEEMKTRLVTNETGLKDLASDFGKSEVVIGDNSVMDNYQQTHMSDLALELKLEIQRYNSKVTGEKLYETSMFYDVPDYQHLNAISNFSALEQLTKLQMLVLNNERSLIACK